VVVFYLGYVIHDQPCPDMKIAVVDTFKNYANYGKPHENNCNFKLIVLEFFNFSTDNGKEQIVIAY
jgi:hypothetical protein